MKSQTVVVVVVGCELFQECHTWIIIDLRRSLRETLQLATTPSEGSMNRPCFLNDVTVTLSKRQTRFPGDHMLGA